MSEHKYARHTHTLKEKVCGHPGPRHEKTRTSASTYQVVLGEPRSWLSVPARAIGPGPRNKCPDRVREDPRVTSVVMSSKLDLANSTDNQSCKTQNQGILLSYGMGPGF